MAAKRKTSKIQKKPLFLPAAVFLILWPLLVHMKEVKTGLEHLPWYPDTAVLSDFFMYVRSSSLLLIVLCMLVVMIDRILLQRISRLNFRTAAPLLIYGILVLLSAVFSVNQNFSFSGSAEHFETVWVLMGYLVICWYFADTVINFSCREQLISYALSGAAIQCVIGLSQFAGYDFWNSAIGNRIIQLGQKDIVDLTFSFTEGGKNQVYMTFYNPNYAAVYIIIMLPLAVYAVITCEKIWKKVLSGILTASLLICLWGTESEAGLVTFAVLVITAALILGRGWKNRLRIAGVFAVCLIYIVIQSFLGGGNSVIKRIIENVIPEQKHYKLQEVTPEMNQIKLVFDHTEYHLKIEQENGSSWFSITNEEGMACRLDYDQKTGRFAFANDKYENLEFQVFVDGEECKIIMYRLDIPWHFVKADAESPYQYYTLYGKPDIPVNAEYAFGKGYERAFTNRLYLWSRTVPLINNYLLIGSGPDTFSLVFPQNDYVTRANIGIRMLTEIISKPHSYYLQIAVQTGLVSLLMLLCFFGRYLLKFMRNVREYGKLSISEMIKSEQMCQLSVLLSVIGFLIMGITNDSVVVTTPIFWAILGIGCGSLNRTAEFR